MADESPNGNGAASSDQERPQIGVLAQYVKDLSFENPNAPAALRDAADNPNLQANVNVNARRLDDNVYESQIHLVAQATSERGALYQLELVYAGVFRLEGVPEEALRPVLLINCPTLLFPFVRRIAADLTREGGYPPLLLDPFDFTSIYKQSAASLDGTDDAQADDAAPPPRSGYRPRSASGHGCRRG